METMLPPNWPFRRIVFYFFTLGGGEGGEGAFALSQVSDVDTDQAASAGRRIESSLQQRSRLLFDRTFVLP